MSHSNISIAVALLFSHLLLLGCSKEHSYTTYEDCLLSEIGESQTAAAVEIINLACRRKFPPTASEIEAQRIAEEQPMTGDEAAQAAAQAAADTAALADSDSQEPDSVQGN